jgi:hypothetical protein
MQSGPGFVPTFLYYFVITTLIVGFVTAKGLDNPELVASFGNPLRVGILFGLLAGGVGAYFNSHEQAEIPLKNRGASLKKLNDTLAQMGYAETQEIEGNKVYERTFPSSVLSGKLYIQLENTTATLSGRANVVRKLQKYLADS